LIDKVEQILDTRDLRLSESAVQVFSRNVAQSDPPNQPFVMGLDE
jgi:hypothetical protein